MITIMIYNLLLLTSRVGGILMEYIMVLVFFSAEREEGRLKNDLRRMNTEYKDLIEQKNILEVSILRV